MGARQVEFPSPFDGRGYEALATKFAKGPTKAAQPTPVKGRGELNLPSAHDAASATTGSSSSTSFCNGSISAALPLLPAAMAAFRTMRPRPIRLMGEPANTVRKERSSSASRSVKAGATSSALGTNA